MHPESSKIEEVALRHFQYSHAFCLVSCFGQDLNRMPTELSCQVSGCPSKLTCCEKEQHCKVQVASKREEQPKTKAEFVEAG